MIPIHLHSSNGEKLTIQVKTGWEDVSVPEYLEMQGKQGPELLEILTGLSPEQVECLDNVSSAFIAEMLSEFTKVPEVNIEGETLGQFETVRSFMRRLYREDPGTWRFHILPYIYGQYKAIKIGGKWKNSTAMRLTEYAKTLPLGELFAFAVPVLNEIEKVSRKYDELCSDSEETDEAGENELASFGIYPVLHMLSGGDITRHEEIMQQSVRSVYTHLVYLNKVAESQKETAI